MSTQGHHLYKLCKTRSLMLHAKFQDHMTFCYGEEEFQFGFSIYWRSGHPGHANWAIYTIFVPLPKRALHGLWPWLSKQFQSRCLKFLTTSTLRTTDAAAWVYYKFTLWARQLGWVNKLISEQMPYQFQVLEMPMMSFFLILRVEGS